MLWCEISFRSEKNVGVLDLGHGKWSKGSSMAIGDILSRSVHHGVWKRRRVSIAVGDIFLWVILCGCCWGSVGSVSSYLIYASINPQNKIWSTRFQVTGEFVNAVIENLQLVILVYRLRGGRTNKGTVIWQNKVTVLLNAIVLLTQVVP